MRLFLFEVAMAVAYGIGSFVGLVTYLFTGLANKALSLFSKQK